MPRRKRIAWVSFLIVLTCLPVSFAQWSEDPAVNLALADRVHDQVQPKLVRTDDGGAYASWFDNSSGGYDVYLQRLDADGNELWAHDGVLIADRSFSSTQDYGLGVDTSGNALLIFRDDRSGSTQITASKIAPDGTLLWGTSGIQLSSGNAFFASPRIAGSGDGDSVAGWTRDSDTRLQKLDPSGSPRWGAGITLSDDSEGNFGLSDIKASDGSNVIVSWVRQDQNIFDPRHIWAQKFSAAGASLWPASHVRVFDGGSIQLGNFPTFITDGGGGAVFSWYSTSPLQCHVQRVLASGVEAFTHNGVTVSTDLSRARVSPDASSNPATEDIFVFWTEMNSGQSQWGVYGQKVASDGTRQWSSTGKVLRAVAGNFISQVSAEPSAGGATVFYVEELAFGNETLQVTRVNTNGTAVWSPATISASTAVSAKSSLETEKSSEGVLLFVWSDDRAGDRDIYGQNIREDGTLGGSCDLVLSGSDPTLVDFSAPFHLVYGLLSDLTGNGNFSLADCAGVFSETPAVDPLENPPSGAGRYYLARGQDRCKTYGDSSLDPDPRNNLDFMNPCP